MRSPVTFPDTCPKTAPRSNAALLCGAVLGLRFSFDYWKALIWGMMARPINGRRNPGACEITVIRRRGCPLVLLVLDALGDAADEGDAVPLPALCDLIIFVRLYLIS